MLETESNKTYHNLADELSEVASKSEVVINAIGDGVVAIDKLGNIQLINPAAQIIIGWPKQDAITLNYKSVLQLVDQRGEILDNANNPIGQALNVNQEMRTSNLTLLTKSGKKIMISLVVSPVSEVASGVIVVFRDITKEKAEEREQAEFISTASHEMRTPVASIEGYLGLALNPNTATIDDRGRDFIMKAHYAAEHLGHLFQDLLDVSKADDGRMSNEPKIVNLTTFIHDIVQGLGKQATEKGLRVIYKPIPDNTAEKIIAPVYSVNLDNDHIREVMDNLLENAIKYTVNGEIIVDVNGDDDNVVISVKDSGIGIPSEDIPHLFQKFYRVNDKETNEIGGTGLGLYLSRRLVEIMGGRIWAESVYKSGSTFYVQLPRIRNQDVDNLMLKQSENQSTTNPLPTAPEKPAIKPATTVPRGEALTPEQIATYVAQQRALAHQEQYNQPEPQPEPPVAQPDKTQPKRISITVPDRDKT